MDVREKLVELLKSVLPNFRNNMAYWGEKPIYEFADCLLNSGVTVQECKLGDKEMPKGIIVDAVPVSELEKLRDYLYAEDLIFMRGLAELNKLIANYGAKMVEEVSE